MPYPTKTGYAETLAKLTAVATPRLSLEENAKLLCAQLKTDLANLKLKKEDAELVRALVEKKFAEHWQDLTETKVVQNIPPTQVHLELVMLGHQAGEVVYALTIIKKSKTCVIGYLECYPTGH